MKKKGFLFIFILLLFASAVFAQNAGDFGLVYKFNPSPALWISDTALGNPTFNIARFQGIGMIYQFSDKVAFQPGLTFGFVKFSSEYEPDGGSSVDLEEESLFVIGLEAYFPIYLKKIDNVSLFISPGIHINSALSNWEDSTETVADEKYKYFGIGALFNIGGQATFGRFAVFSSWGIGFDYVSVKIEEVDVGELAAKGPAFSTNHLTIGLIYYVGD